MRVALVHHDEGVGHHLVVDDRVVAHVVVVDEGGGVHGPLHDDGALVGQVAQVIVGSVADVLQLVPERKIEGGDLVVGKRIDLVDPVH